MTRTRGQRALQERLFTALAAADGRFTMPAAIAALCAAPGFVPEQHRVADAAGSTQLTTLHWEIALDVPSAVAPLVAGGAALNAVLQPPSVLFMTALPDWLAQLQARHLSTRAAAALLSGMTALAVACR